MLLLNKITIAVTEVAAVLLLVLNKNEMMNMWNPMTSLYHLKIRFTQNKGITFPFCLGHGI